MTVWSRSGGMVLSGRLWVTRPIMLPNAHYRKGLEAVGTITITIMLSGLKMQELTQPNRFFTASIKDIFQIYFRSYLFLFASHF